MKLTFLALTAFLSCTWILVPQAASEVQDLYKSHCSSCHATNGSGATTAGKKMGLADLRSPQIQRESDDELFQTIANGVKHKQYPHAFLKRGLTADDIRQVVAYLRKLPKGN